MVFGDNVRARGAARALPRTPTRQREEEGKQRKTNNKTTTPSHTPPFHPTQTITAIPQ
jgi:hypothetical protein